MARQHGDVDAAEKDGEEAEKEAAHYSPRRDGAGNGREFGIFPAPALDGLAALRIARKRGIPLVYEIRAFWEDAAVGNGTGREGSLKYRMTRALENRVVAGADADARNA